MDIKLISRWQGLYLEAGKNVSLLSLSWIHKWNNRKWPILSFHWYYNVHQNNVRFVIYFEGMVRYIWPKAISDKSSFGLAQKLSHFLVEHNRKKGKIGNFGCIDQKYISSNLFHFNTYIQVNPKNDKFTTYTKCSTRQIYM